LSFDFWTRPKEMDRGASGRERTKYRNRSWRTPPVRESDVSTDGRLPFLLSDGSCDVGRQDGVILPIRLPQHPEPCVGKSPTGPVWTSLQGLMELIDRLLFSSDTMGGAIGFTPAHTAPNEPRNPKG